MIMQLIFVSKFVSKRSLCETKVGLAAFAGDQSTRDVSSFAQKNNHIVHFNEKRANLLILYLQ